MTNSDASLAGLMSRVQDMLGPDQREEIAEILAQNRKLETADPSRKKDGSLDATPLKADGCLDLGQVLDTNQVRSIVEFLKGRQTYAAHVPVYSDNTPRSIGASKELGHYASYKLDDVLLAPGVLDLALRKDIVGLAEDYLGAPPYIYSVHAWWTFSDKPSPGLTHGIHRDLDDYRFLSMFVYLTDVLDTDDGPTVYFKKTHKKDLLSKFTVDHPNPTVRSKARSIGKIENYFPPLSGNAYHLNDILKDVLSQQEVRLIAPAGGAFIADTFGLHSGSMPIHKDRLVLWIRYGLYKNLAYKIDKTEPVILPQETYGRLSAFEKSLLELLVKEP